MLKKIDARGMKCPRPIIELALAQRMLAAADEISIMSDDPAFENDVQAWCDATNCELLEVRKQGTIISALIRIR